MADEHIVKPDVAAAPFFALNENEIPVDRGAVAVVGIVVCAAGSEMDGSGDLLIEEDVAHRVHDIGIYTESEFADITCAFVCIEDMVDAFGIVCRCFDDLAVFKEQADLLELKALINAGRVIGDTAVDAVADGTTLSIG